MKSFEAGPSPEQIKSEEEMASDLPKEEVLEVREQVEEPELKPEQAFANERGALERFSGKAKKAAGVLLLVSALSIGSGLISEARAQEEENPKKPDTLSAEQIEKRKPAKELIFKEFKAGEKENGHDVKMEFLDNEVETTLKEQNIQFNEKEGSFTLLNEGEKGFDPEKMLPIVKGALTLKFQENNGVRTEKVEVSTEKIVFIIPGQGVNSTTRKIIKIKSYNSDGSADIFTISDGKVAGAITEKPTK